MLPYAIFGIHNSALKLAVELVILFLVVIWLALVYWTYADARRRIADPLLVGCATLASLFPYVGTIVYMIVRPPEYLDDVRERELEMQAAEARLAELGYHLCPHCDFEVEKDFLRCPNCMRKLKDPCHACGRPLDPTWKVCPFCEAEIGVPGAAPGGRGPIPRRQRRRAEKLSSPPPSSRRPPDTRSQTEGTPAVERTLILVKPDAFARNLTGEIIARFERKGLRLVAMQLMTLSRELASQHYAEHEGKPFYEELVSFITSGPLVALALEGESAITAARQVIGATDPLKATTGSIRGDYAVAVGQNMVHGSDAPESAAREVGLFFPDLG